MLDPKDLKKINDIIDGVLKTPIRTKGYYHEGELGKLLLNLVESLQRIENDLSFIKRKLNK